MEQANPASVGDRFNLQRFVEAQERVYDQALSELRNGRKLTHWMWFIFPQIDGLGFSSTTRFYSIKSAEEARHYLAPRPGAAAAGMRRSGFVGQRADGFGDLRDAGCAQAQIVDDLVCSGERRSERRVYTRA